MCGMRSRPPLRIAHAVRPLPGPLALKYLKHSSSSWRPPANSRDALARSRYDAETPLTKFVCAENNNILRTPETKRVYYVPKSRTHNILSRVVVHRFRDGRKNAVTRALSLLLFVFPSDSTIQCTQHKDTRATGMLF